MTAATITPRDRLSFTLFMAASLHAALILGVGFSSELNLAHSPTIEVTLSLQNDVTAPDEADFAAATNQLGAGTEAEVMETTTTEQADFHANEFQETITPPGAPQPETLFEKREFLTTASTSEEQVTDVEEVPVEDLRSPLSSETPTYEELAREIASLEARISQERQALAKEPRVKRLTSVATKSATEAAYLNMWRQKVERIGNANFPAGGQFGALRMLVVIQRDGTLKEVTILQSSGNRSLDQAALRIVRLAAPFADFPVEMRKEYDELEIIRTWEFTRRGTELGG